MDAADQGWTLHDSTVTPAPEEEKAKGNIPVLVRVYVNIEGRLPDGHVFLDSMHEEMDFILGQAQVAKGVEMALCQLPLHSHVLIRCLSDYGYSNTRRPKDVPADSMLFFQIIPRRYEKEMNLHEMKNHDKLEYAQRRREWGKARYGEKKYRTALRQYEKGMTVLEQVDHTTDGEKQKMKDELYMVFLTNSAQCAYQLGDYITCLSFCSRALTLHPYHVKALYRKAHAHIRREEWSEARRELMKIIDRHNTTTNTTTTTTTPTSPTTDSDQSGDITPQLLTSIHTLLKSIDSRQSKHNHSTKQRLDGFLKHRDINLYEDMPDQAEQQGEEDDTSGGSTDGGGSDGSFVAYVTTVLGGVLNSIRGWCRRPDLKEE